MYFNSNESDKHIKAKEKLFSLILAKRVELVDSSGESYDIFLGKHEDEFLHMESFIMDYSSKVLFSNRDSPCKKYMSEHGKSPLCDMQGYYGAFEELPCEKCVTDNFREHLEGSSKFASYRPDISFGYEGIHRIWIEIKYTNGSSPHKISFCKSHGIVILEIDAEQVLNFDSFNGTLTCTKLEPGNVGLNDIAEVIISKVNKNKYIHNQDVYEMISDKYEIWHSTAMYHQLKDKLDLVEMYRYGVGLAKYLGFKGSKKILVTRELHKKYLQIEKDFIEGKDDRITNAISTVVNKVNEEGIVTNKLFKDTLKELLPEGFKSKVNYNDLFAENNIHNIMFDDYRDELMKMGTGDCGKRNKFIVSDEVYLKIN